MDYNLKGKTLIRSSLSRRNLDKFLSNKLAVSGLIITLVFLIAIIFVPLFTKYDPSFVDMSKRFLPASSEHILGTDSLGRDLFTRLLYGGRISIFVGVISSVGTTLIGVIFGCLSGYFGGKADSTIVYISEIFMAFPSIILVIIAIGFFGRGLSNIIIIFIITGWTGILRIIRSRILSLREEPFVECCRANGISGMSIMFKHMLPNTLGPVIVNITLSVAGYVLSEAGLSFLGLGVPATIPTWGNIINAARSFAVFQNHPVIWIAPGIAISLFVLGINFLGDGLRDVFDTAM